MFLAKIEQKTIGKAIQKSMVAIFLTIVATLLLGVTALNVWAGEKEVEIPFDEANVYIELNNTDGDLGLHALIDGEAWKRLEIEDPMGRRSLKIKVQGRLGRQGLTELFFESAEPTFDELPPEKFFRRFPEGEYEIEGITLEGIELESVTELTHLVPAPASNITANGVGIPEGCEDEPVAVPLDDNGQVVIMWDPVTKSHPELGRTNEPIEVEQYQVVLEQEDLGLVFSTELPPNVTALEIPAGFMALGEEFKLEILVREESGNQTAVETCFKIE